jgi:hypothetical protein
MHKPNFTFIEVDDIEGHVTYQYGLPLRYPDGVAPGDRVKVTFVGIYQDDEVGCHIVQVGALETQPSGTVLHLTTSTKNGVAPVESGRRATEHGWQPLANPIKKWGTWR